MSTTAVQPHTNWSDLGSRVQSSTNFQTLRQRAANRFLELGIPTRNWEDWRTTPVASLGEATFVPGAPDAPLSDDDLSQAMLTLFSNRVVLVNGRYRADLTHVTPEIAKYIHTMASAGFEAYTGEIGRYTVDDQHPFMHLNTALFSDAIVVHVPKGVVIQDTIHIVHYSSPTAEPIESHPRILIVAEENSQATIVETYTGVPESSYFTNAVTEVRVDTHAVIDHYRYQQESLKAWHLATLDIHQERASSFSTQAVTFGAGFTRNDVGFRLNGEGCFSVLNGFYQVGGNQFIDNHTRLDHAHPNCESHEFYKGILGGKARGVFNGKILVRQIAQKTNAKQTNRNLLLSNDALINSNPQLEIFADDVKCTHGATIGQLDENQIYYLRSRGIPLEQARKVLSFAFANDIIERIKPAVLRAELERRVLESQNSPHLGLA